MHVSSFALLAWGIAGLAHPSQLAGQTMDLPTRAEGIDSLEVSPAPGVLDADPSRRFGQTPVDAVEGEGERWFGPAFVNAVEVNGSRRSSTASAGEMHRGLGSRASVEAVEANPGHRFRPASADVIEENPDGRYGAAHLSADGADRVGHEAAPVRPDWSTRADRFSPYPLRGAAVGVILGLVAYVAVEGGDCLDDRDPETGRSFGANERFDCLLGSSVLLYVGGGAAVGGVLGWLVEQISR